MAHEDLYVRGVVNHLRPALLIRWLSAGQHSMGISHKLFGRTPVEVGVALRCIFQRNNGGVDRLCILDFVMQDAHHQLSVVAHAWALTGGEPMTLRPAQADADAERAGLCICVDSARIIRNVEAGYSQSAAGTSDLQLSN